MRSGRANSRRATAADRQYPQSDITRLHRRAHRIASLLHNTHGSPRLGNKDDPLDELIFILLSQMTTYQSFSRVYDRLKVVAGKWEKLIHMPLSRLKRLIKDAGLSHQKGARIKTILRGVKRGFGTVSLDALHEMSDAEVEHYLTSFPGVGTKTAKCVMMYSLGRQVLPVDTHVWRVARRLELVSARVPYSRIHDALEEAVPPADRYSFHVNGIVHGRTLCLPLRPHCGSCPLRSICPTGADAAPRPRAATALRLQALATPQPDKAPHARR